MSVVSCVENVEELGRLTLSVSVWTLFPAHFGLFTSKRV